MYSFCQYFIDKIVNLRTAIQSKLSQCSPVNPFPDLTCEIDKIYDLPPVTTDEVLNLIKSSNSKSCSLDFIPTSLLKSCSTVFSKLITTLANLSFSSGTFPAQFKVAKVTPLLKKPSLDTSNPANYRPISNLCNVAKLLEQLFLVRMLDQTTRCSNFNQYQSAYSPRHSTGTGLLHILDKVDHSADNSSSSVLVSRSKCGF